MLRNHLAAAWRGIRRSPGSSVVSVLGLAAGIACALLVFLLVQHETSFDRFHEKADRLYRLVAWAGDDPSFGSQFVPPAVSERLTDDNPEVLDRVRLSVLRASLAAAAADSEPVGAVVTFVDPSFFRLFTFPAAAGRTPFDHPDEIVLAPQVARSLFGREDVVGETVRMEDELTGIPTVLRVTAVLEAPPATSHLDPQVLAPLELHRQLLASSGRQPELATTVYVEVPERSRVPALEARVTAQAASAPGSTGARTTYHLEPLLRVYLHGAGVVPGGRAGDFLQLVVYGALAAAVLLVACINVMNLFAARAASRRREIGVRKACGASRSDLAAQFLLEAGLLALIALAIGLALAEVAVVPFGSAAGTRLALDAARNPGLIGAAAGLVLLTALLSGLYPALATARLDPVACLREQRPRAARRMRRALVAAQVTVSALLFSLSFVVGRDIRGLAERDLGFRTDGVTVLSVQSQSVRARYEALKSELLAVPGVEAVACSSAAVFNGIYHTVPASSDAFAGERTVRVLYGDPDYLAVWGVRLAAGVLPQLRPAAALDGAAVLVNRAADRLAPGGLLGKTLTTRVPGDPFSAAAEGRSARTVTVTVAGVVEDFAYQRPTQGVSPLVFLPTDHASQALSIRVAPAHEREALEEAERAWRRIVPGIPFVASSASRRLDFFYAGFRDFRAILWLATAMATAIALLGLYALAAFETERRTKEIGIRRALGATPAGVCARLVAGLLLPAAVANLATLPLGIVLQRVLYGLAGYSLPFRYGIATPLVTAAFSLLVTVAATLVRSVGAARGDPARSLRYE